MNKIYSTLVLLFLCEITYGQISLDASMAPPINSMLIYYDANVPSPPFTFSTSGTTNTWDFASLTPAVGAEDTIFYFPPSNFAGSSAFPAATHATYEGGDQSITMLTMDQNSVTYLGFIGDLLGTGTSAPMVVNPPATTMTFPYTYGSYANPTTGLEIYTTGAAIGQPSVDSVHYKTNMNLDASVTASGDMILPSGTMQALLERRINTTIDTAWMKGATTGNIWVMAPGFPQTTIDSAFYWYSDQSLEHYAHALYDNTGLYDVHYFMAQINTGIATPVISKQPNVFPNPAHDFLGVRGLNLPAATDWSVYNTAGEKILQGISNMNYLNVSGLTQGAYILRFVTTSGEIHQVTFIKN